MDTTALQRSTTSFRRQGSSGLVWDDKFLSGDLNQMTARKEEAKIKDVAGESDAVMRRNRSCGGGHMYRTPVKAEPLVPGGADPPSPRISACGFCGVFGKSVPANKEKQNRRRKS